MPACRIGQDGFGFAMGARGHLKVPQIGRVIIQDDVEIGANSCVDRGALKDTIIGEGTKIDNLVQIGHNVVMGRHCVIVGQVGISGSTELGRFRRDGRTVRRGRSHQDRVGRADRGRLASNHDVPRRSAHGRHAGRPVHGLGAADCGYLKRLTQRRARPAATSEGLAIGMDAEDELGAGKDMSEAGYSEDGPRAPRTSCAC